MATKTNKGNFIRVFAKMQNRMALGVFHAYMELHPGTDLNGLRETFPNSLCPDRGVKELFLEWGEAQAREDNKWKGYFSEESEALKVGDDGRMVAVNCTWTSNSLERLKEKAAEMGIEVASRGQFDEKSPYIKDKYYLQFLNFPNPYEPSVKEMEKYHGIWDNLKDYVAHESALNGIFINDAAFARNTDLDKVIIKCSALNDFYSTNIRRIYPVAKQITEIPDFDARLAKGCTGLVDEIALVDGRRNYSFATKYCSHHKPELYPIFDSYVFQVLLALKKQYPAKFRFTDKDDLKDYAKFKQAIYDFRNGFGLQAYTYKDVDRYMWLLGKRYFNKYERRAKKEIKKEQK